MTSVSRLTSVRLPGPAGSLEGLLQERDDRAHALLAVVCHPHPLYGGTLHNKVVHRVASVLHRLGAAVLRFNFRGAGTSEGRYDQGLGELEDARAALAFLRARYPGARVWAAGFSFGSWIAARLVASEPEIERVVLVAPSVKTSDYSSMHTCVTPKLVFQGTADDICPLAALEAEFPRWAEPKKRLITIPGGTHFFDRQLPALGNALEAELAGPAAAATPRP